MTPQQIKDNAPHGATHYIKGWLFTRYYKRGKHDQLFKKYVDGIWIPSFVCPTKPKPL